MVIDFHTHIFPDAMAAKTVAMLAERSGTVPSTDATADGLIASMEAAGAGISVVLPVMTKVSQFESITRFAAQVNGRLGLISFGGMHPDSADVDGQLDRIAAAGLPGIKLHPDYQGVFVDDERYVRIIRGALRRGLLVSIHAGLDAGVPYPVHCPPERAARMLDLVYDGVEPEKPSIILAHSGGNKMADEVIRCLAGREVMFDLAYTLGRAPLDETEAVIRAHGAKRILFATDSPWSDLRSDVSRLGELSLKEDEREDIAWRNAARLLALDGAKISEKALVGSKI